jgi:transposase
VGEQPTVACKQSEKERVTGFGSINPLSGQLVAGFAEKGNTETFKKHLKTVLKVDRGKKKIIVYMDNVRFHHARALKPFLEAHPELEIRYLPAYSPDLNPVERVWWYMRKRITHNRYMLTIRERIAKFWQLLSPCLRQNEILKNICAIKY